MEVLGDELSSEDGEEEVSSEDEESEKSKGSEKFFTNKRVKYEE